MHTDTANNAGPSAPTVRQQGERPRRHPWEIPMVVVAVLGTVAILVGLFVALVKGADVDPDLAWSVLLAPLIYFVLRGRLYATQRVEGVKITETQFPEGYRILVEAAQAFGMKYVPDAYVVLGNGEINAFASGHGARRFVAVHSDLFEVGGRLHDEQALRFFIGHEVGHIAAGHTSFWRQVGTALVNTVPIIGATLSRSQEYTADNYAYAFCRDGHRGMTVFAAGKYLYPHVDFDAMADRAHTERGFFVWLVNAMTSHPVNIKRFAALRDRTRPGRLFL
jgi:Zn-dependent protease with chaperone function